MAYVVSHSAIADNVGASSFTIPLPGDYAEDDLLIILAAKDTNAGTTTPPSGWTAIEGGDITSSGHTTYCYYKLAGASESDPVIASSDSDSWSGLIIAIRDVDQISPIDVTAHENHSSGGDPDPWPSVTTTAANSLILFLSTNDGASRFPYFNKLGAMPIHQRSDDQQGLMAAWTIQKTASSLDNVAEHRLRLSDDHNLITIAVNNSLGGLVPAHHDMDTVPAEILNPLVTNHASTDVSSDFPTINGQTTVAQNIQRNTPGGVYQRYMSGTYLTLATANVAMICGQELGSPVDLSGKLMCIHTRYDQTISLERGGSSDSVGGSFLGLYSGSRSEATFWQINALNLRPNAADSYIPVIIKPSASGFNFQEFGGGVDVTDIEGLAIGSNKINAGAIACRIEQTMWCTLNKFVVIGGGSAKPFALSTFYDVSVGVDLAVFATQNSQAQGQFFSLVPVEIGNGGYATFFSCEYQSLEFAPIASQNSNHQFMAENGDLWFEINSGSSDEVNLKNSLFNMNGHTWRINPSSSISATYEFGGHIILNGVVELKDIGSAISGLSFVQCEPVTTNGADLSGGCTFDSSSGDHAIRVTSQADIDKLDNCIFQNNAIGIQVDNAGSLEITLDNVKFNNNTVDIEYTGSGVLTVNNSNGSNTSTFSATGGGSVVIQNSVSVEVTALDTSGSAIENARVYILAGSGGPLTEGDLIYNGLTNSSGVISSAHNYTSDQPITGRIRKGTSSPYYKSFDIIGTITSAGFFLTASMQSDD